ncbi:MAG: S8 family serine peptidase [Planctomycetes bacterium]|nr:S8 family serine peptidase [Planctomycetota bacterium]MCB9918322.1 S8 family serine peptidase [Planctomycetota bacterium]
MSGTRFLTFVSILHGFCATTLAQNSAASTPLASAERPSVEAAIFEPATFPARVLVEFAERSFDLEPLAAAIRRRSAEDVEALVRDLEHRVARDQAPFADQLRAAGGKMIEQFWLVNACSVDVPDARSLEALRRLPNVLRVIPDGFRRPSIKTSTNADNHAVDALQMAGFKGKGVSVAILDSGLDITAPGRLRPHRTFYVNGDPNNRSGGGLQGSRLLAMRQVGALPPDDTIDHGTAVAAVAAGETWASTGSDAGHAPLAGIVGYSMSDMSGGFALLTTMVKAFQGAVADSVQYNIRVINLSYEGTNISYWTEEQAIDLAARIGDMVVVVSGGNGGNNNHFAHGSTNRIAVGAVRSRTPSQAGRDVTTTSTRGPLPGGDQYPNLVACGDSLVLPVKDIEGVDRIGSGTSFAAPQVAGAAVLFRSVDTTADALVTRAAIFASSEDVAGKNRYLLGASENLYGFGFLRDDRLLDIARGVGTVLKQNGTVTTTRANVTYGLPVVAGRDYAVAIAWDRLNVAFDERCNLDVEVRSSAANGRVLLGRGNHTRIVHELVRFRASANEVVQITVSGVSFVLGRTSVPFGLVAAEALPFFAEGTATSVGQACGFSATEIPVLAGFTPPEIGTTYRCMVQGSRAGTPFALTLGASFQSFGAITLPWPLAAIGANGCTLYVSPDIVVAGGVTDARGEATLRIAIPPTNALLHSTFGHQALSVAPMTNQLGLLTSNAMRIRVGGDPR